MPNLRTRTQRESVIPTAHSISSAIFFKLGSLGKAFCYDVWYLAVRGGILLVRLILGSLGGVLL